MRFHHDVIFTGNNQITLLNNGADFFPALLSAIDEAEEEVRLETYIFSQDVTGKLVQEALCRAAQRQVKVYVIIDWWGTGNQRSFNIGQHLTNAGIYFRLFNPWFMNGFVRTHRKLVVIDKKIAFIGGININHDLVAEGENKRELEFPRWDFAARVIGPLVTEIHQLMLEQWQKTGKLNLRQRLEILTKKKVILEHPTTAIVAGLAQRDNFLFRRTIRRAYLQALGQAKSEILIATPYFAPGHRFHTALINAAKRGVKVALLIGVGDFRFQDAVTHFYYSKLLKQGVQIIEYSKSQLHGKVAVVDGEWATIGSSNCDGFSLFLNQEANLVIKDREFSKQLSDAILQGIADGIPISLVEYGNISWRQKFWYGCAFLIYSLLMRLIAVEDFM